MVLNGGIQMALVTTTTTTTTKGSKRKRTRISNAINKIAPIKHVTITIWKFYRPTAIRNPRTRRSTATREISRSIHASGELRELACTS